jgi:hypothetical protein
MTFALAESSRIRSSSWSRRPTALVAIAELMIAVVVFMAYRAGRLVTNDSVETAMANSERIVGFQRGFIGHFEREVQQIVLEVPGAIEFLNHFYVFVHFPATLVFLVSVFLRRREAYSGIWNRHVGVRASTPTIRAGRWRTSSRRCHRCTLGGRHHLAGGGPATDLSCGVRRESPVRRTIALRRRS